MKPPFTQSFDDPQTYEIIGAAFEVHGVFGNVFSEPVYGEALTLELQRRGNFGAASLQHRRIVFELEKRSSASHRRHAERSC